MAEELYGAKAEQDAIGVTSSEDLPTCETFIGKSFFFSLEHCCRLLSSSFGPRTFIVGSSLMRPDFRDVDLRCILDDAEFAAIFGTNQTRLYFLERAISEWLTARTFLPVDFQFQRQTKADKINGARCFIGAPLT